MSIRVFNKPAVIIGGGSSATLSSISISSNGTYSASLFGVDGFDVVDVDVQASATGGNEYRDALTGNIGSFVLPNFISHNGWGLRSNFLYLNKTVCNADLGKLEWVAASVFYSCISLSYVQGSSVLYIDNMAFVSCTNLKSASFPKCKIATYGTFSDCGNLSQLYMPELAVCTLYGTFMRCTKLEGSFPKLCLISNNCFANCQALVGDFPKLLGAFSQSEFQSCRFSYFSAKDFFMAGNNAFYNCISMESFITDGLYVLSSCAFQTCYKLKNIDLELVTRIGGSTFAYCSELSSIFMPICSMYGSTSAPFRNCLNLETVTLGAANFIGANAFISCSKLESLYLLCCSVIALSNINAFQSTPFSNEALLGHYGSIYVPSSWVSSYKTATNWATYSDRITSLPSEFDSIYAYAYEFFNRTDLTEIPLSKRNVTYICPRAFNGLTNNGFTSIEFPNCRGIGYMAFANTPSLATLSLPECIVIGEGAFSGQHLSMSSDLYFPKVRFLDNWCFSACSKITGIEMPECVAMWSAIFSPSLTKLIIPKARLLYQGTYGSISSYNLDSLEILGGTINFSSSITSINLPNFIYNYLTTSAIFGGGSANGVQVNAPRMCYAPSSIFSNMTISSLITDNLIYIGSSAFARCYENMNVNGIASLAYYCFAIPGLTKALLLKPSEANQAGSMFRGAINVSKVAFGCVNYIPLDCFYRCSRLKSLYLFQNFVADLFYSSSTFSSTPINGYTAYTDGQLGSIFVPARLLSDYQNHSVWSWYSSQFVGLTDEQIDDIIAHWDD